MRYERTEKRVLLSVPAELWDGERDRDDIIDRLEEATPQDLADAMWKPVTVGDVDPRGVGPPSVTIRCGMCGKRFGLKDTSLRRAFDESLRSYQAHGCFKGAGDAEG